MSPKSIEKNNPVSHICVSKEEAKDMKVGEQVSVTVSGKVKSITEDYAHNDKYYVDIEAPSNSYEEDKEMSKDEMNSKDVSEKTKNMSAEEMRKRLPKAERDY